MATFAARRLQDMADNTAGVLAVELLAACQGVDFRTPLKTSGPLQLAPTTVREQIAFYDEDRYFAPDIAAAKAMIVAGVIAATASDKIAL